MVFFRTFRALSHSNESSNILSKIVHFIPFLFLFIVVICLALLGLFVINRNIDDDKYSPQQIHLAIGEDNLQMVIMWSTRSDPEESIVKYGYDCQNLRQAKGTRKELDSEGRIQYIHSVTLKHLKPQSFYCYYVGSHHKWSKNYEFITFPKEIDWSPSIALFGDMGLQNGRAIPSLIENTIKGNFDVIIDVGDIAYTLFAFKGRMGDAFMRAIEPFAARVPFMVVPGNHEYLCYGIRCPSDYGMSYETRFQMPKSSDNTHYTFTLGRALFIGISTEVYFQSEVSDLDASQIQKEWLQQVLYEANKPQNRARHPWIILYGHRPLYCSSISDCFDGITYQVKEGFGVTGSLFDIENILYEYGVDIAFWGHEHNYERMFPVFNQTVYMNSLFENPYVNPRATVHFISGTGGMHSETEPFSDIPPLWSAFRSSSYGYTRFTIFNETHIYLEQIDVDQHDKVIDSIWIIQESHIAFPIKNNNFVPLI